MLPATPQRTAETRLAAPAPMIAPEITCVVDSGKPTCEAERITAAPDGLAGEALRRIHLDDPAAHRLDDAPAADVGPGGDRARGRRRRPRSAPRRRSAAGSPLATSARKMMPIVFCASLVPWASENRLAGDDLPEPEAAVDRARPLPADDPVADEDRRGRRRTNASTGATSAGTMTFSTRPVADARRSVPSAASVEPTMPPISACEDDDGSPKYQVSRFQKIAPIRPAKTIVRRHQVRLDDARGDRRRDRERQEGADEVQDARPARPPPAGSSRASRSTSRRRWRCRGSRW